MTSQLPDAATESSAVLPDFQALVSRLHEFWAEQGCAILQPYDMEVGAATFHPATTLRSLGKEPWRAAHIQPSRRPKDGRYGANPNRLQHYYQYQVIIKPAPENGQELFLKSLLCAGLSPAEHDLRFVEDDWESPTLGAWGLGWEIWCDGMEIAQYTYFQQMGGLSCDPVPLELTYGLERIAAHLQAVDSIFDVPWGAGLNYGAIFPGYEQEYSAYNFEYANPEILARHFSDAESECSNLLQRGLILPAYDQCLKACHLFNLLEARGVISVTERTALIARVRRLAHGCCQGWLNSSARLHR